MPEDEEQQSNLIETLSRVGGIFLRRRWCILITFCSVTLVTIGALWIIPNRYTSSATLVVVQQQVPQRYVVPNSTTDVTSALQAMKQEVLSRTQLLRMINDFGLYQPKRLRLSPEELVALMLKDIDIVPINENPQQKDIDAFRISFTTETPILAQQVTQTLTSLFINEYLRTSAEQATNTTNFLHERVVEKGQELQAQEERLRDFKMRHVGELPEQQQGNLGILTGLQGQLQNTMASLNRAQQHRALLQAQLEATPRRRPMSDLAVVAPANPNRPLSQVDLAKNELTRLESIRAGLLSKGYTAEHPDVARNRREIAQAEEALRRAKNAPPESGNAQPVGVRQPVEETEDSAVVQIKGNLETNRLEIESLTKEENRLKSQIAVYESRINQTPVREQEEAGILRDTEVLRQQYADLQKKEQESQLATNLEKQQGGQQFRLIDPASLPSVPSRPKRAKLSLGGAAAGLFLGLTLAFVMEARNPSFRTESELTDILEGQFVLGIPAISTPFEDRRRKSRNMVQFAAACAILLVTFVAEFYVYMHG